MRQTEQAFEVISEFSPMGDQPAAIEALTERIASGARHSCLLGATGTGKTFTMAHVIARVKKPTLIISHNKTLAAQLYEELREFLPRNSVNYFVSYYDYYQPEAYIPQRDIYIEKDASRNDDLEQLRLATTSNLLSRRDTVVVASVSCIFGLGSPEAYGNKVLTLTRGSTMGRRDLLKTIAEMQYSRGDVDLARGTFRARGDVVEVWPAYERFSVRIELFGDEIERIDLVNPTTGELLAEERQFFLFPAVHYVMPEERMQQVLAEIREEMEDSVERFRREGKLLEAQRLLSRTQHDLELIEQIGFCPGVENYSRFMDGRAPGERPFTLLDYFDYCPPTAGAGPTRDAQTGAGSPTSEAARKRRPNFDDWLVVIDESHVTLPQVRAMFNGDRQRKQVLVEHGFRVPGALDNRPLRFEEFEAIVPQILFVSATPSEYELDLTGGEIAEQVIRPTGLLDPIVEVFPARGQVEHLLQACQERIERGDRVLVTALTKRLCEDLTEYLHSRGLKVRYLHSEIDTLDRVEIITGLRRGEFDVLVGVNLLREGLDLPEVSLVCILDADKEGFLRSPTSLIQQMGRAARNEHATVYMYADQVTPAMREAMEETERRRKKQEAFNTEHGITPRTIRKAIRTGIEAELKARKKAREAVEEGEPTIEAGVLLAQLEEEMLSAAEELRFEQAAALRDQMKRIEALIDEQDEDEDGPVLIRRSEVEKAIGAGAAGGRKKRRRKGQVKKKGMPGGR